MTSYKPLIGNGFLIKLSDIEARYRTSLYDLLLDASQGKIELLFEVPVGKQLILLHGPPFCDSLSPTVGIPHRFGAKPDYLVLLPGACAQLIREPFVQTKYSEMGYARDWKPNWLSGPVEKRDSNNLDYDNGVICGLTPKSAVDADKSTLFPAENPPVRTQFGDLQLPWMYWGMDSGNPDDPAAWFKVEIEDLYLITQDFFIRKKWLKEKTPKNKYWFDVFRGKEQKNDIPKEKLDFLSDHLLRACEASEKLWGCKSVIPGKPESYPTDDEVVRWLMDQDFAFARDAAENVASLIKPTFAKKDSRPIPPDEGQGKRNKNPQFHSERLLLACEASLEHWGRESVISEERSTHPSNQKVINWLQEKDPSFTTDAANQVASLIRPSFSEAKGRRSK